MDDALRARLFNVCQPGDALPAGDARYVALDEKTPSRPPVRGRDWGKTLARRIGLTQVWPLTEADRGA